MTTPRERDPRIDPRPMDIVARGGNFTDVRTVTETYEHWLRYTEPQMRTDREIKLWQWRKWAKDGEIIHAAD